MKYLSRFKYIIVFVAGTLLVTVIGDNCLLQHYRYSKEISELEEEIDRQETLFAQDSIRLVSLERDPEAIRKIARERYFMKASDEDIFVLSDEIQEK